MQELGKIVRNFGRLNRVVIVNDEKRRRGRPAEKTRPDFCKKTQKTDVFSFVNSQSLPYLVRISLLHGASKQHFATISIRVIWGEQAGGLLVKNNRCGLSLKLTTD